MRSPTHKTVRLAIARDRASKSNIRIHHLVALPEAIGGIEKVLDVGLDRLFQWPKAAIVTGALQPIDNALREILIAAADSLGQFDILNVRMRPQGSVGRQHHILEAARFAGTAIEDAADRG